MNQPRNPLQHHTSIARTGLNPSLMQLCEYATLSNVLLTGYDALKSRNTQICNILESAGYRVNADLHDGKEVRRQVPIEDASGGIPEGRNADAERRTGTIR